MVGPGSRRPPGAVAKAALFFSGMFAGGAIDHGILALKRRQHTPYGIRATASVNWILALIDAGLALAAYLVYRRA